MLANFSRSALTLLSGTVFGQLIVLAISPLLTRLYTPQQFGEFSIYVVILYIFMAISAGRYDAAITVAKSTKDANSLARYSIIFSTATATVVLIFLTIHLLLHYNNFVKDLQLLLPVSIFLAGINTALVNIQLRRQKQRTVAVSRTIQALTSGTAQVLFGFFRMNSLGLIAGQALGLLASLSSLANKRLLKAINLRNIGNNRANVLRRYASFPKFEMASALAAVANNHIPTIIIGLLSATSSAGAYALAQRVIATPLNIIAGSIASSTLAFGRTKSQERDATIFSAVDSLGNSINAIVILTGFSLIYLFGWIFGEQWATAGIIAGWICLPAGSKFKTDSTFSITTANNKQREGLKIQLGLVIFKAGPLLVLLPLLEINTAIIIFALINTITHHVAVKKIAAEIIQQDRGSEMKFWSNLSVATILLLAATHNIWQIIAVILPVQLSILFFDVNATFKLFKRIM
jgi:O-antigen/teichoic acid export membrane protein